MQNQMAMMEAIGRQEEFVTSATNVDRDQKLHGKFHDNARNKLNSNQRGLESSQNRLDQQQKMQSITNVGGESKNGEQPKSKEDFLKKGTLVNI